VVFAPKTGARRTVRLLAPLAEDLNHWRELSGRTTEDDLIFPGVAGEPWTEEAYKSWRRRGFQDAATAVGVPKSTPYALRHSFCSLLLAEGRTVIDVARQLGHGANLTLSTYGHVIDEFAERERTAADEAIWAARAEITAVES
jgi:integrase